MSANTSILLKTIWFLVSRLMILAGMVLFFLTLSTFAGAYLAKLIYGVDIMGDPSVFQTFDQDPTVLTALKLVQIIGTIGGMIIPAWLFPKAIEKDPSSFLGVKANVSLMHLLLAICLILVAIPLVSWLIELNSQLQFPTALSSLEASLKASEEAASALTKAFVKSSTIPELGVNMLVVAIVPAIAEELLFRGALQQFLTHCFKNIHFAVVLGAMVFSAFHGQVYGFLPRWILGIVLGYLFAYSGSIWPGILAHFVNNALSLIVTHFSLEQSNLAFLQDEYHFPIYLILLSAFSSVGLIYLLSLNKTTTLTNNVE
jgi:uncharacterized protein